ncbi:cache domain-containing protein [Planotetraspora sp. A-T 1434]|uniref:cache domain-containing protein n=1 Tax=Planotetraspora sp. A-T 1434 TaxID=2979219 RepID=UPI0021BFA1AA|nr:cache domain-containing protein [Planotetraspora sp. A-T 1434]MCT9930600.1 cache domain-containing protein [Planotetraspora sp. A-T 1434]
MIARAGALPDAEAVVERVREAADGVFAALGEVRDATVACLRPRGGRPVAADLAALRPLLWARLNGSRLSALIAGIGFIAAPGLLADAPWYLEWWQENPAGDPVQLLRDLDPSSSAFYDYTHWDWYTGPHSGAERTICGPYVDYLCTDEYSLTLSVPVVLDGVFIGVAAADVFVRRFESAVLPALRRIPATAFLVNAEGRVVASNTARWVAGSVYRGTEGFAVRPVGDLPLSLVTAG